MIRVVEAAQHVAEQHPVANWLTIGASVALSFLQPLAALAALILCCLQIYGWFDKRRKASK